MGLHMVVPFAKLHIQLASHGLSPAVAAIACPLALKLLMGLRLFRDEAVRAASLFVFRLRQIAFDGARELPLANGSTLERALRLLCQTVRSASSSNTATPYVEEDIGHDTFHTLSIIAL